MLYTQFFFVVLSLMFLSVYVWIFRTFGLVCVRPAMALTLSLFGPASGGADGAPVFSIAPFPELSWPSFSVSIHPHTHSADYWNPQQLCIRTHIQLYIAIIHNDGKQPFRRLFECSVGEEIFISYWAKNKLCRYLARRTEMAVTISSGTNSRRVMEKMATKQLQ